MYQCIYPFVQYTFDSKSIFGLVVFDVNFEMIVTVYANYSPRCGFFISMVELVGGGVVYDGKKLCSDNDLACGVQHY